ncbi:MAG TPA: phosphoribosyltransferase family protein [Nitrososphaeraceae archaeon]|jgi:predicted phosphoribosyltransferase
MIFHNQRFSATGYTIIEKIFDKFTLKLKSREAAANVLTESIKGFICKEARSNCIVMGIPKGGIVVGNIIASKLGCKFDIVVSLRLRAKSNEEVGIGAVAEDGIPYLNYELIQQMTISQSYIENEIRDRIEEVIRRRTKYRIECNAYQINDKTVILTDDGAATGATIIAAARWIKRKYTPRCLIVAVPIAPVDTVFLMKKEVDRIEVILRPPRSRFCSVEQFYQQFHQVNEAQIIQIMKKFTLQC